VCGRAARHLAGALSHHEGLSSVFAMVAGIVDPATRRTGEDPSAKASGAVLRQGPHGEVTGGVRRLRGRLERTAKMTAIPGSQDSGICGTR
jgi:hypothetical protein